MNGDKMEFKNMQRLDDPEKEIIRTVLNNGFFTIAHNFNSDDRNEFISVFKKMGAKKGMIDSLEDMFNYLSEYEFPSEYGNYGDIDYADAEEVREGAWENMIHESRRLEKLFNADPILKRKMMKYINW